MEILGSYVMCGSYFFDGVNMQPTNKLRWVQRGWKNIVPISYGGQQIVSQSMYCSNGGKVNCV